MIVSEEDWKQYTLNQDIPEFVEMCEREYKWYEENRELTNRLQAYGFKVVAPNPSIGE
jgi:hypothetical protein